MISKILEYLYNHLKINKCSRKLDIIDSMKNGCIVKCKALESYKHELNDNFITYVLRYQMNESLSPSVSSSFKEE